jgi:fructoselysine-6-P-deglycase FrlB-like protein
VPEQLAAQIELSRSAVEQLELLEGGTVVARGVNYGTCFEIALKIRELSGLLFEAYSAADLMHGPVAAIGRGWPVLAVVPTGPALASMRTVVDIARRRTWWSFQTTLTRSSRPTWRCRPPGRPGMAEPALVAVVPASRWRRSDSPACADGSTGRSACRR